MKNILIIAFLFSVATASAQWKETGRTQVWTATIHLKDSVTGQSKGTIQGYVKTWERVYWDKGKIDKTRGSDWEQIKSVMDINHKKVAWKEYDYYDAAEPGTIKHHIR